MAADDTRKVIKPQPGPQEAFSATSADIAIYGGAAGGGKSFALLLEPLRHVTDNPEFAAVFFRRNATQVRNPGGLWDESAKLYPLAGARPIVQPMEWVWPRGGRVKFAHLEHEQTVYDWQGSQIPLICCEVGTLVRMADGSAKAVECLAVGDLVQTLQGPRRITQRFDPNDEQCVLATVLNDDGSVESAQVHARSHRVLTPQGWRSYDDIACAPRPSLICESKECRCVRKCVEPSGTKCRFSAQLRDSQPCHQRPRPEPSRSPQDHQSEKVSGACTAPRDRDSCCGWFQCGNQGPALQPSIRLPVVVARQSHAPLARGASPDPAAYGAPCAPGASSLEDSPDRYSAGSHPCDEPAPSQAGSAPERAPRQGDAEGQSQSGLPSGGLGTARTHSCHRQRYAHPYTGEARQAEVATQVRACVMAPCGIRRVVHLAVDGENHYITASGIVNQNCFDELTHFSKPQFFYMLSRNRSGCGVRPYIRATTNPDADSWVADFIAWWIDQETGLPIPERSGVVRWFVRINDTIIWSDTREELLQRHGNPELPEDHEEQIRPKSCTFIAAKLTDNRILMKADPDYLANLKAQSGVERARLLDGNWKIRPAAGMYFRRHWCRVIEERPPGLTWIRFWDLAATEKTDDNDPDWTVGVLMGVRMAGTTLERCVVADVRRLRESPLGVERAIKTTATADGPSVRIGFFQDPGQAGKAQASALVRMLAKYSAKAYPISGDKVTLFGPFSAQAEAGAVEYVRGPWNDEVWAQLEGFPEAAHDDDADGHSGAFNALTGRARPIVHTMSPRGL